ncbi:MAG: Do family serine endopeptidase [Methylophagaceae bacterium]
MKPNIIKFMLVGVLMFTSLITNATLPFAVDGQPLPTLAPMLDRVRGAVVNISTVTQVRVRKRRNPFFLHYFDQTPATIKTQKRQGLGSGVVFDAEAGLILTNAHVIKGADKITITLKDGREAEAKVVGTDKGSDVAVIQVDLENLLEIPIGNSDVLRVGDFVVAIGNPFGLQQTVTSGIVSALGRSGLGIESYEDFIQTDASINPGNSGGALVNLRGELVGINTAIVAPSGGNVGIGFSIPINMALQIRDQLVEFGEVQRGRLGVRIQDLTPKLAQGFGLDQVRGAVITRVDKGSMADSSGVKVGDVVLKANDKVIIKGADLRNVIGGLRVGGELRLDVLRGGTTQLITTNIGDNMNSRLKGASFIDLDDQQTINVGGVFVSTVEEGSSAWINELRPADIIVSVNRRAIRDLDNFKRATANQNVLLLNIIRGNGALFLLLQ